MRIAGLVLGLMFFVSALPASADDSPRQNLNIGVSYGYQGLALRKTLGENALVYIGVSYGSSSAETQITTTFNGSPVTNSSSTTSHTYGGSLGGRYYLSSKKLSDFIQLELGQAYTTVDGSSSPTKPTWATVGYGLEYYLDPHLSLEARVGATYTHGKTSWSVSGSQTSVTTKSTSIPVVGIAITYYW